MTNVQIPDSVLPPAHHFCFMRSRQFSRQYKCLRFKLMRLLQIRTIRFHAYAIIFAAELVLVTY